MSHNQASGYRGRIGGQLPRNYSAGRDSADNSNLYPSRMRANDNRQQTQYSSPAYDWTGQAQSASQGTVQNNYGNNNSWRDTQPASYEYQRQNNYYMQNTPPVTTSAPAYSNVPRDSYAQDAQGLNHLAYASGLEPTPTRNLSNNRATLSQNMNYNSGSNTQASMVPNRTDSPAENNRYAVQPPVSHPMRQERSASSTSSQNMAVNAAAALARAVSNRYPNTIPQSKGQSALSPSMANVQVQASVHRTSSPYAATAAVNSAGQTTQQRIPVSEGTTAQSQTSYPAKQGHTHQISQPQLQRTVQNSAQHTNSIANLVSAADATDQETYENNDSQEPMPNFIDPTQVFNPYHREHERKKREAAEAEVRRQAEEQTKAEVSRKSEEAMKHREKEAVANSKSKVKKKPTLPAQDSSSATPSVTEKEVMAAEMKAFMERMKEFRSKDPATFSQLWNDMRGKDNTSGAANAEEQTVSPRVSQPALPAAPTAAVNVPQTQAPAKAPRARESKATTAVSVPPGVPLNGFRVVVDDNPEDLPDLGKYPAMRRIRGTYGKSDSPRTKQASLATPYPNTATLPTSPALPAPMTASAPVTVSATAQVRPIAGTPEAWPEHRRRAVAIAAIHLLKATPENARNPVTAQDIAAMLERNPSYLDLCAALELRGLKFQRNSFAKELLKNVPDLNGGSSEQTQPRDGTTQDSSTTIAWAGTSAERPVSDRGFAVDSAGTTIKPEPFDARAKQSRQKALNAVSHQGPLPGTKEAAARKRGFAELVDLTDLNDNEDYVMPSKMQRLEDEGDSILNSFQSPQPGGQQAQSPFVSSGFTAMPSTVAPLKFDTQAHYSGPLAPTLHPMAAAQQPSMPAQPTSKPQTRMLLAKRLDKTKALQKSYYDPKTVARDILIASGRHPSERPLNAHLAGMLGQYIELDSDLGTFDWDVVDPGGPLPRQVEYVNIPASRPKFKIKDRTKRPSFTRLSPSHDQSTRLPKEAKRHPASRSPAPPIISVPEQDNPPSYPTKLMKARQSHVFDDEHKVTPSASTPQNRKISVNIPIDRSARRSTPRSFVESVERSRTKEMDSEPPQKKRIGRPPGAKNKTPSVAALKKQANNFRISLPAQPQPVVEQEIDAPAHLEYKCKWIKCQAKLHNLATLRRHIPKRHAPSQDEVEETGYICWWKKCPLFVQQGDGIVPSKAFDNKEEWLAHIEETHMRPIGRSYGDGPSTIHTDSQTSETDKTRYLTDEIGRTTTPAIALDGSPNLPTDALELTRVYPQGPSTEKEKADVTAQNAYMKAHGSKSTDQRRRAIETVRAMTARKEKIGPGIDRGGCTLINEERRSTFIQNPGVVRIIEAEY